MRAAKRAALFALLLLAALLPARSFAAERVLDPRCDAAVAAWIARADEAMGARIGAASCLAGRVKLVLVADKGGSLEVEVAPLPGPAFRTLGRIRVSPIAEIEDWKSFSKPEHDAFEELFDWLKQHEDEVVFGMSSSPRPDALAADRSRALPALLQEQAMPKGLLLFLASVFVLLSVLLPRRDGRAKKAFAPLADRGSWPAWMVLFLVAFLLRAWFGPFAPHHVNGQGPMWIGAVAEDSSMLTPYGPGYVELFSLFRAESPMTDSVIFWTNAFLSALAAPLVAGLGLALGLSNRLALLAGFWVALDSVSIRMGATEAYFSAIVALTLASSLSFAIAAEDLLRRRAGRALCLLIAGILFATQAARIHPIAWGPALATALSLGVSGLVRRGERNVVSAKDVALWALVVPAAIALVIIAVFLWTTPATRMRMTGHVSNHFGIRESLQMLGRQLGDLGLVPGLIFALVALRLARPRVILWPALLCFLAALSTFKIYGQSELWLQSYLRVWLAFPLLAAVSLIPPRVARQGAFPWVAGLFGMGLLVWNRQTILERTTEQGEYRFFRAAIGRLPEGCTLAYLPRQEKRIVLLPEQMLPPKGAERRRVLHIESAADARILSQGSACFAYARTSICSSQEARRVCEDIEKGISLVPQAETSLPAAPSYDGLPYDTERVSIGLFLRK